MNYRIHDIVTVDSDIELPLPARFRTDSTVQDADIAVQTGQIDRDEFPPGRVGKGYYWHSGRNSLLVDWGARGRWWPDAMAAVSNLTGNCRVRINDTYRKFGDLSTLIRSVLAFKLWQRNATLIHAGGLVNENGDGVVIHGFRNMGKSSTSLRLAQRGHELLGDDTLLIKDDTVYSYPRQIGVSPGTLIPDGTLTPRETIRNNVNRVLEKLPAKAFPWYPSTRMEIEPDRVATIGDSAPLEYAIFLEPASDELDHRELEGTEAQRRAAMHSYFDGDGAVTRLHHLVEKYIYFDARISSSVLDNHREIILSFFEEPTAFEVRSGKERYTQLIQDLTS